MNRRLSDLVRHRAGGRCEYCQLPQSAVRVRFHIEHIIPKKHGGRSISGNLALACHWCNRFKGPNLSGIDPQGRGIVTLFHPRRQSWSAHFRFEGPTLHGNTAIGRATVKVLNMNAQQLWNLRRDLMLERRNIFNLRRNP